MGAADRVVKNTGILYARMGITMFMSLYTTRIILVNLGVTDFGIFNLVGGAIAMLTFLNTAMAAATQRFMSYAEGAGDEKKLKSIFNVSVILHILIAIVILVVLEIIGHLMFKGVFKIPLDRIDSAKIVYQCMVVSTLFTIVSVPYDAVINAHENMFLYAVLGVLESVLKLATAFYLVHTSHDKLVMFGLFTALTAIFLLIVRRIYCKRNYKECELKFKVYYDKVIFKDLTNFAAWSFLGASTSMVTNYGQGILMNTFFGPIVNTAQGIANQVSGQLSVFAGTMQKALNPVIGKSEGAGDRSLMLKASMIGSKVSFFLLMLFFIPVLIEMPYIFRMWLKDVPQYAIIFCRLLLIRNLIEQLFTTLGSSISAVGNIRKYQIFRSLLNFVPLIAGFILFKMGYSPSALYVVFIIYALLGAGITVYFAKYNCNLSISFYFKDVILPCVVLFILISAISYTPLIVLNEGLLRLMVVLCVSTMAFLILVWFFGFSKNERKGISVMVVSLYSKIFKKNIVIGK